MNEKKTSSLKNNFLILFSLWLSFFSCQEIELPKREWPYIKALEVEHLNKSEVRLEAEILSDLQEFQITKYGFVLSSSANSLLENSLISVTIEEELSQNKFSSLVKYRFQPGITYYFKPFIVTKDFTVYGNTLSFVSYDPFYHTEYLTSVPLPNHRRNGVEFTMNGHGYVGFGEYDGRERLNFISSLYRYSIENNSWSEVSEFPGRGRSGVVALIFDTKAFFISGKVVDKKYNNWSYSYKSLKENFMYDSKTNTWAQMKDFPGTERSGSFGFVVGDTGYFGGGKNQSDFWAYDPSDDSWRQLKDLDPQMMKTTSLFGLSDGNYGFVRTVNSDLEATLWKYDRENDSWQILTEIPCRGCSRGIIIRGKYYLSDKLKYYEYDLAKDEWNAFTGADVVIAASNGFTIDTSAYLLSYGRIDLHLWQFTPL